MALTHASPSLPVHERSMWAAVESLTARAPCEADLRFHGLDLLAARVTRRAGAAVTPETAAAERTSAATSLLAPLVLERVLAAASGPVVMMKGLEVAQWWEQPLARTFRDVDLLVPDAAATWHELRRAGFEPVGDPALYEGIHHLRPLAWPGLPLVVEVHHEPKWIRESPAPTEELIATAVPSATGIPGLLTIEPARHAVVVAVHAWAHVPLGRLGRLVDVAALSQGREGSELAAIARSWEVERVWETTRRTLDSLLRGSRRPVPGRLWARHLWDARERTVLERHLEGLLAPFSGMPPRAALRATRDHVARKLALESGETRRAKLRRSGRALANAFERQSDHDSRIDKGDS